MCCDDLDPRRHGGPIVGDLDRLSWAPERSIQDGGRCRYAGGFAFTVLGNVRQCLDRGLDMTRDQVRQDGAGCGGVLVL
jgi:hypothetical protein